MSNLIFVSNRLPITITKTNDSLDIKGSIGGLATGLKSIHSEGKSIWAGWCGIPSEKLNIEEKESINKILIEKYNSYPIFLTNKDLKLYYYGFSNKTIWPLFHYFTNLTTYENNLWEHYKIVNKKYYKILKKIISHDDSIWIHDYQLLLLPKYLKEDFPDAKIGFFLHIPFPSYEIFRLLPWRKEILHGMLGADLIGFHTYDYARHFVSSVRRILDYESNLGNIYIKNRIVKVDTFPMGIDYKSYSSACDKRKIQKEAKELMKKTHATKIILSIDRLDYTKGIPGRIKSYDLFLEKNPQYKELVTLILIVAPSRTEVVSYAELLREIEELVSHTNGRHGTIGWVPVWFLYRSFSFETLTALYGIADVLLVTPLRDGMNLIAKEYIATRSDCKGMLVLSETAGASNELGEAIIVNANDIEEVAYGIKNALEMPEDEKIELNTIMNKRLKQYDVNYWAKDFIEKLEFIHNIQIKRKAQRLTDDIIKKIKSDYKKSKNRLILLDYDGTLVPFYNKPEHAKPDHDLLNILKKLTTDQNNNIIIISGRERYMLDKWFHALNINLVAAHGMWLKDKTKKKGDSWEMTEVVSNTWKDIIRPVLEIHTVRTPGSFIEEKEYSLAWHYRRCDPDLATVRVTELKEVLLDLTNNLNIGLLDGNKVIEVKDTTINKGRGTLIWLNKNKWDFILAIGDDWTDESMFAVLPKSAYTIKVGYHFSQARFEVASYEEVRILLKEL